MIIIKKKSTDKQGLLEHGWVISRWQLIPWKPPAHWHWYASINDIQAPLFTHGLLAQKLTCS
jgi:hypothetical protein